MRGDLHPLVRSREGLLRGVHAGRGRDQSSADHLLVGRVRSGAMWRCGIRNGVARSSRWQDTGCPNRRQADKCLHPRSTAMRSRDERGGQPKSAGDPSRDDTVARGRSASRASHRLACFLATGRRSRRAMDLSTTARAASHEVLAARRDRPSAAIRSREPYPSARATRRKRWRRPDEPVGASQRPVRPPSFSAVESTHRARARLSDRLGPAVHLGTFDHVHSSQAPGSDSGPHATRRSLHASSRRRSFRQRTGPAT